MSERRTLTEQIAVYLQERRGERSEHIAALKREIKRLREALHIAIVAKCKAEDAAHRVTWVWEKALIESLPSGMRELVMEAVFKNAERAQVDKIDLNVHERIADLERENERFRKKVKRLQNVLTPPTYCDGQPLTQKERDDD